MLSQEQQLVVENIDGHNVVVALPGSGKTHTLKYAIDHLLEIHPRYKVLVLTFTNSATAEMNQKIQDHISERKYAQVRVSTFHSLCKEMSYQVDRKRLVMGGNQKSIVNRAMNEAGVTSYKTAEEAIDFYSAITDLKPTAPYEKLYPLYETYLNILKSERAKDFGVIFRQVILGLRDGSVELEDYDVILVDEYQDTDPQQLEWLELHGRGRDDKPGAKITVVGDDDQSIYGFRNSLGYQGFTHLQKIFDSQLFMLTVCRRCAPEILEAAGKVVQWNDDRIHKDMISAKAAGGSFTVAHVGGEQEQYDFMVEHIKHDYEDWAVLARNNNSLDQIENILTAHDIPYNRISGKSFFELPQVVMQLNMISCIAYDNRYSAFTTTLGYLKETESNIGEAISMARQLRSIRAMEEYVQPHWSLATKEFIRLCNRQAGDVTADEQMEAKFSMMENFMHRFKPPKSSSDPNARSKDFNFFNTLCEIGRKKGGPYIARLRSLASLLDQRKEQKALDKSVVTLSTFHSSKGLEWPRVWMVDVDEETIPSKEGLVDKKLREEERRLLYVAMTRAEDELIVTSCKKPSSFLTESFPEAYDELLMEAG